jgi:hypothetical protein
MYVLVSIEPSKYINKHTIVTRESPKGIYGNTGLVYKYMTHLNILYRHWMTAGKDYHHFQFQC